VSDADDRAYRRLSPLTPLVRSGLFLAAAAFTLWDDVLRGDLGPLAISVVVLLVAGGVYGFASWYRTKFWIEAEELRVDTGVINRQSRRIRIDRLQGIDIVQPFVARLLGLAELRMDVAGGDREGSLAFLTLADARDLKDTLLVRRDRVREVSTSSAAEGGRPTEGHPTTESPSATRPGAITGSSAGAGAGAGGAYAAPAVPERQLARVDVGMLALSILLSTETITVAVLGVVLVVGTTLPMDVVALPTLLPIIGGVLLVMFRRFAGSYNFTVTEGPSGMQVRRGLFDLNTQTIALPRLQGVLVSEPVLWRRLGWARLDVSIAGYASGGQNDGPSASIVLPVGDRAAVLALARHVLGGVDPDGVVLTAPPDRARWATPVWRRFMGAGASQHVVVSREGWVTRRTHVVPHARIQSLRLVQGPWQRRLGLADLEIDSPPGPVRARARHRPAADARRAWEIEVDVSRQARVDRGDRVAAAPRSPVDEA